MNVHERPQNSTVNCRLQALSLYIFIRGLRRAYYCRGGRGGGAYNRNQLGGLISGGGGGLKAAVYGRISARCRYPSY